MSVDNISRRKFVGGVAAAGLAASVIRPKFARAETPPNIIFVLIDDQRWDAMGCAGNEWIKTPNMDRLAGEGVRFSNSFVTISLCSPSRACFLTGQYAHNNGVMWNGRVPTELPTTFLERLQSRGYDTAFIGKWHIGGFRKPQIRGVNHEVTFTSQGVYNNCPLYINGKYKRDKGYITDRLTDYAVDYLEQSRNKPFCLYLSHKAVHANFVPAERHKGMYRDAPIKVPEEFLQQKHKSNMMHVGVGATNPEKLREKMTDYYEALMAVDENLGRVLDTLDKTGQAENTMVVFAGDNGFLWGEHGLVDKRVAYEESIRIPLLARFPAGVNQPGRAVDQMVHHLDVCPTFLDMAGIPVPKEVQGRSLTPFLRNENPEWRSSWLYEYFDDTPWPSPPCIAVRTNEWKYITYPTGKHEDELFNLVSDPREQTNLAARKEHSAQLNMMKHEIVKLMTRTGYPRQ